MHTTVLISLLVIMGLFIILLTWFNTSLEKRCMSKIDKMIDKYKQECKISSAEDINNFIEEINIKKRNSYLPPSKYDGCLF